LFGLRDQAEHQQNAIATHATYFITFGIESRCHAILCSISLNLKSACIGRHSRYRPKESQLEMLVGALHAAQAAPA
jgi:hypothetical protein